MPEQITPVPQDTLARAVFGPLGGVVEVGAVNATGTWDLTEVSMGAFLTRRQDSLRQLFEGIRSVCGFGEPAMAVADELGRFRDHEVPAAFLLLWSAGVTGVPQPLERLEEPPTVRRMCRMAADLQLTNFLHATVTAALVAGTDAHRGAPLVAEVLRLASDLADPAGGSAPRDVFRIWRVSHLPALLRPESSAPESGKAGFRAYDEALERALVED
ncbi:hypothetical protein ACIPSE_04095 [Streptomyces sp. NPDC090106]|uniref:hypothetical protein n=1 Tax=Streptomyces sp. NPDC090106 TaxID=3365946 RepID=UPI0038253ADD